VRMDMSEYMEKHSVSRFIGAPPGYVGFEEGGQLTEAVRRRPYSVILLDEVEKAHPDVLNVLLQILDDGRLTDGQGRLVDFRNAVIIMTSNIGSDLILESASATAGSALEGDSALQAKLIERLRQHMRPEFINRIDDVIVFRSLNQELIRKIVDIQVQDLNKILKDRDLSVELTNQAKDLLASAGFDPIFGARPLKRVVYKQLQVPLSKRLLSGEFHDGDKIDVDVGSLAGGPETLVLKTRAMA